VSIDDYSISLSTITEIQTLADDKTVVASNATTCAAVASWQHPYPSDERLGREEAPMVDEEKEDTEGSGTGTKNSHKTGKAMPFVTTLWRIDEKGGSTRKSRCSIRSSKSGKIDWSLLGVAIAVLLIVLAAIIGTILGTASKSKNVSAESNNIYNNGTFPPMNEGDDDMAALAGTGLPTDAPSLSATEIPEITTLPPEEINTEFPEIATFPPEEEVATTEPTAVQPPPSSSSTSNCTRVIKAFPNNTIVSLAFEVASDIWQGEVGYAAVVFHKTFNSLSANCDPQHCRHITSQAVIWDRLSNSTILSPGGCDAVLELQLEIEGSYLGCAESEVDEEFFGLFFEDAKDATRNLRGVLRRHATANFFDSERLLQQDSFGRCITGFSIESPSECPADSRSAAVVDIINDMASSIPAVCRLESVQDGPL
jgi:hypothetical protein